MTILYSYVPAGPEGLAVYQISADVKDVGLSNATRLSVTGDIKILLSAM